MTRDELILSMTPTVKRYAAKFARRCRGASVEDLESEGYAAACRAADTYDVAHPSKGTFGVYANVCGRQSMVRYLRDALAEKRGGGRPMAQLEVDGGDGERSPLPADPRASDPADIAAARELLAPRPPSVRKLERSLPSPAAVADRVTRLREAMFGAIDEAAVTAMMGAVMKKAQAGDLKAAKQVSDLLSPSRSGVVANQQVVVVQPVDV